MFKDKRKKRDMPIDSLLGEQVHVEGDVSFSGGMHLDGTIRGSICTDGQDDGFLHISEQGQVDGNIRVPRMVLNGAVRGEIYCREFIQLGPKARIEGNLHYVLLEIAEGAEINGSLVRHAEVPAEEVPALGRAQAAEPPADDSPSLAKDALNETEEESGPYVDGTSGARQ